MSSFQPGFDCQRVFLTCLLPIWVEDVTRLYAEFEALRSRGILDLGAYLQENSEAIPHLLSCITVLDVNPAAVKFYEATSREHLLGNLDRVMETVDMEQFDELLLSIWNEEESFNLAATQGTLKGNRHQVLVSAPIPRRDDPEKIVPVTVTDIGAQIRQREHLQVAPDHIQTLEGFLPICASCKKIRDDAGNWNQLEEYISSRTRAQFTHGLCPECSRRLYPPDG